MSVDQIIQMLENALKTASGMPGVLGAIFVAVIGLVIAVLVIANYFYGRGLREQAAYAAQLQAQETHNTNLAQMQKDASQALLNNMTTVYQQDYDYFLSLLKATPPDTEAIYAKLATQFHAPIAAFVYDATIPPEQKAAQIILLMKAAAGT